MNKKLVLLGAALLMTAAGASAQKRVTGRVVNESGEPVVGASVKVKGAKVATTTDGNGKFTLTNVPASAKHLDVTYLGMASTTVSIAGNVNVVMKDNEQTLGEAYVVAYGRATKASFTGAAAKVKGEKVEAKSTTEVTQALQGEVAGVQVIQSDGNPGSSSTILIRGIGSLYSSVEPLIILDGMPYAGSFSSIDPKDIASIDIMKDATAAALYGSRGANGVLIITTKRGEKGQLSIGADVKYSVSGRWIPTYDVIKSPERYVELSWEGLKNQSQYGDGQDEVTAAQNASAWIFDYDNGGFSSEYNMWNAAGDQLIDPTTGRFYEDVTRKYSPESWKDALFRTGQKFDGSINLSGGSDNTQFYTSIGYTKDKGYLVGADFQRFSVRSNIETKITPWLKGTVNLSYANLESNAPVQDASAANNALDFMNNCPPIFPVYQHDANGNLVWDNVVGGYKFDYGNQTGNGRTYAWGINPAGCATLDQNNAKVDQFNGKGTLEATFLKDFRFQANLAYTFYNSHAYVLTNPFYGDAEGLGRIDDEKSINRTITGNQILNWGHTYDNVHHVSAFVGHESYWRKNEYQYASKNNLVRANDPTLGNAVVIDDITGYNYGYSLDSWFGQVAYDFNEKYFFNAAFRADGSSRFAKGNRWGNFGSVGAAWNITKESFMANQNIFKNLKLKASWGLIGNQSIGVSGLLAYYPYSDIYALRNNGLDPVIVFSAKGNKDLSWEKTSNFNVGLEFNLLDIIEGEFNYFNKLTYDMIFMKSTPSSIGYSSYPVNDGKMRNSGVEFNLIAHAIKTPDVALDIRLNGSHYKNEIVKMPMDDITGQEKDFYNTSAYGWQKGHSMYDYYLRESAGVNPENGNAQWNKYTATFADGSTAAITDMEVFKSQHKGEEYTVSSELTEDWNSATKLFIGESALPKLTGGFGFDLRVKDFTLSTTFSYALGGKAYDQAYQRLMADGVAGANNWHKDIENRWQKPGDVTDVPKLSGEYGASGNYANASSDRWLISRSYLSLNNVALAWNLPEALKARLGFVKNAQIYVNGENLFYISARKGFLPSTSISGMSSSLQYLPSSSVTFGLKVTL